MGTMNVLLALLSVQNVLEIMMNVLLAGVTLRLLAMNASVTTDGDVILHGLESVGNIAQLEQSAIPSTLSAILTLAQM
jgi:hypothetical protein